MLINLHLLLDLGENVNTAMLTLQNQNQNNIDELLQDMTFFESF